MSKVLLIDDEADVQYSFQRIFDSPEVELVTASSGEEGLRLLPKLKPDLVVMDVRMGGMNGLETLRRIRQIDSKLMVILMTAYGTTQTAIEAMKLGAYDYLLKPFDREQLLATVRRAMENRRLKLENRAYQTNLEALVTARTEQLRQAITTLERSYDITLEALGNALDLKDAETEGHSKRVTAYTIAMARAMGLSADQIRVIARGAFLHDIGKMAIPDAILRKPGALDQEEIAIMREHCYRGYQILRRIPFLSEAAEIVYSHQEKYDGTGYPRGLKGDQIPLGARIFSVADTLDAMMSNRPYRAAQPFSAAREEIQRWSGRQFDPQVVATFLQMPENIWDDLRKGIDEQIHRFAYSAGKS